MLAGPCRGSDKQFTAVGSTNIGDKYQDPGRFNQNLRGGSPLQSIINSVVHTTPFKTQGNQAVKKAELKYRENVAEPKGSQSLRPFVERMSGFYNRRGTEPFTNLNTIGYSIDPYERK